MIFKNILITGAVEQTYKPIEFVKSQESVDHRQKRFLYEEEGSDSAHSPFRALFCVSNEIRTEALTVYLGNNTIIVPDARAIYHLTRAESDWVTNPSRCLLRDCYLKFILHFEFAFSGEDELVKGDEDDGSHRLHLLTDEVDQTHCRGHDAAKPGLVSAWLENCSASCTISQNIDDRCARRLVSVGVLQH